MFIEVCILLLLPYVYMSLYSSDKQYYTADVAGRLYRPSAHYCAKASGTRWGGVGGRHSSGPALRWAVAGQCRRVGGGSCSKRVPGRLPPPPPLGLGPCARVTWPLAYGRHSARCAFSCVAGW